MHKITISAPARLHLGFVGLQDHTASEFGALGLAIDRPQTVVEACRHASWKVSGLVQDKVERIRQRLAAAMVLDVPLHLNVVESIPEHIGLGSGTQLAMALATACTGINGLSIKSEELSGLLGRGTRSGIGTAAFTKGGFLVDCHATSPNQARAISKRIEFPHEWRFILVYDDGYQGIHDQSELDAFKNLGALSHERSADLHALLMTQVLPALEARDIASFGQAITAIQYKVGDFFAPVQGGRFLSVRVADVLDYALRNGAAGIGQSSWGPTGFILVESESAARVLQNRLQDCIGDHEIHLQALRARNTGASVRIENNDRQLSDSQTLESV